MKRLFMGCLALMTIAVVLASTKNSFIKDNEKNFVIPHKIEKEEKSDQLQKISESVIDYHKKLGKKVSSNKISSEGNVTVNTTPDNSTCTFDNIIFVNEDYFYKFNVYLDENQTSFEVSVEPGTYLVGVLYNNNYDSYYEKKPSFIHIIRENIEIGSNTELFFNPEEATNLISFRSICPDGKKPILSTLKFNDENRPYWDYSEANVEGIYLDSQIYHEKYGFLFKLFGNIGYNLENGDEGETAFDFLTNNVSEQVWFIQGRMITKKGETVGDYILCPDAFYTLTGKAGSNSEYCLIENSSDNFVDYNGKLANSPALMSDTDKPIDYNSTVTFSFLIDGKRVGANGTVLSDKNPKTPVLIQENLNNASFAPQVRVELGTVDVVNIVFEQYFPEFDWTNIIYGWNGITNYPAVLVGKDWVTSYFGNCYFADGTENFSFQTIPNEVATEYPGNPAFYHYDCEYLGEAGDNAPILVVMQQINNYETSDGIITYIMHDPTYVGRVGESRVIDMDYLTMVIKRNEEIVFEGLFRDYLDWERQNAYQEHEQGLLALTYTDRNIAVDGLPGYNIGTVTYDENKEDKNFPTLQMLWFKNSEGFITSKFDNAEDGIIELSGADFNWHNDENGFYYTPGPVELTVEYSPNNAEEWITLDVEEIPELFYWPGYGYFWRGNLSQVEATSENGWFDLRVSMIDEAGNSQVQSFGPAFYIADKATGVTAAKSDNLKVWLDGNRIRTSGADNVILTLYGADGRIMSVGNDLGEIPSGLWIVKAEAGNESTVRKVMVK